MREAPAITIISKLHEFGAKIVAYDPKAMPLAKQILAGKFESKENKYDTLSNADALIILTEWNEFRRPDFSKIKELLKNPVIFDGRNIYEPERMKERGIEYVCVGREM